MTRKHTISHDRQKCIGCGMCAAVAPQTWELDNKDGLSNLIGATNKNGTFVKVIDDFDYVDNYQAAVNCPRNCIKVSD